MSAPLVFLDTETTGLHPRARVWEVAGIRREVDGAESELHLYVGTSFLRLREADLYALNLGRFHERHPAYRSREADELDDGTLLGEAGVAHAVEAFTRGAVLVGSNVAFDARMLTNLLQRHDLAPTWQYRVVDVASVAVGWLVGRGLHRAPGPVDAAQAALALPWRSEALAAACGVEPSPPEERHTAMGDARWVRRWWDALDDDVSVSS